MVTIIKVVTVCVYYVFDCGETELTRYSLEGNKTEQEGIPVGRVSTAEVPATRCQYRGTGGCTDPPLSHTDSSPPVDRQTLVRTLPSFVVSNKTVFQLDTYRSLPTISVSVTSIRCQYQLGDETSSAQVETGLQR